MTFRNLVRRIVTCEVCGVSYIPDEGEICKCVESDYEQDNYTTDTELPAE